MACAVRVSSLFVAVLLATETIAAIAAIAPVPVGAQFFEDRFPFQSRRQRGSFSGFEAAPHLEKVSPPDYSRAPSPKQVHPEAQAAVTTKIIVLGDAMADWLGYGLELAYADSPEIDIVRQHRTNSGLIRSDLRSPSPGEFPDWPQVAREMIAAHRPKFALMMLGLNDRKQIRETASTARLSRITKPPSQLTDSAALELDVSAQAPSNMAPEPGTPSGGRVFEFRSDAWSEAYTRRIDETIAALKTAGVPVFWVGLPPLRGPKSAVEIPFLNDLYRSRADKAGIIYVDVWEGFVDDDGRYTSTGADVEGQTRRLRTSDGAFFTQAGARKLAYYVEREIQRWITSRDASVAVALPAEPKTEATRAGKGAGAYTRPLSGPAVPLTRHPGTDFDDLLGSESVQPVADALAAKVLVRGEATPAPAGRADDFAWPRRDVAAVGTDPVVTTTDQPMTPMLARREGIVIAASSTEGTDHPAHRPKQVVARRPPRQSFADAQWGYRRHSPFYQSYGYQSWFGGRW
jgi:uncharacterized protein